MLDSALTYLTIAASISAVLYLLAKTKPSANVATAENWFATFDVSVGSSRYKGLRSRNVHEFYIERNGVSGIRIHRLYKTHSGRFFEILVETQLAKIVAYTLIPIAAADAEQFMRLVEEDSASTSAAVAENSGTSAPSATQPSL